MVCEVTGAGGERFVGGGIKEEGGVLLREDLVEGVDHVKGRAHSEVLAHGKGGEHLDAQRDEHVGITNAGELENLGGPKRPRAKDDLAPAFGMLLQAALDVVFHTRCDELA